MDNKNITDTSISITIPNDTIQQETGKIAVIRKFIKAIKIQIKDIENILDKEINKDNQKQFEEMSIISDSLINDCYSTKGFTCNRNDSFIRLIYLNQRLFLKIELYKLNETISDVEERNTELNKKQELLDQQYTKVRDESNNLVYNILGFIASFSVVSAAIAAIEKLQSLSSIMLFMAFTAFILLTTLIGLHNFYKSNNDPKNKLQNNYFLWRMLGFVIILLIGYKGIEYVHKNLDDILDKIGIGIGKAIIMYEEEKTKNL